MPRKAPGKSNKLTTYYWSLVLLACNQPPYDNKVIVCPPRSDDLSSIGHWTTQDWPTLWLRINRVVLLCCARSAIRIIKNGFSFSLPVGLTLKKVSDSMTWIGFLVERFWKVRKVSASSCPTRNNQWTIVCTELLWTEEGEEWKEMERGLNNNIRFPDSDLRCRVYRFRVG